MLLPADQRRLLGAFLRARREAQNPSVRGLPLVQAGRRRTPGLRREEVAQSCGLSTTWYTWLEQGRDIALSAGALARLAGALSLSAAERAYLFELTRQRDPAPSVPTVEPDAAPPELLALLHVTVAPAYLLDRLWCVQGWNEAAGRLFAPWFSTGERFLLRYVFLDPGAPAFIRDWENRARRLVAEFRAGSAPYSGEIGVRDIVGDLLRLSPLFGRFWNDHAVLAREGGLRVFDHPQDGTLRFEQATLVPSGHPDHKLVVLLPEQARDQEPWIGPKKQ